MFEGMVVEFNLLINLVSGVIGSVACWVIHVGLFSGRAWGGQVEMKKMMWRYGLIKNRCWGEQWRYRGEGLRCVATRRLTSGMSVNMKTDYLEKRGLLMVKINNNCRVFRCTVNWARARLKTALIAGGAQQSSSVYAAGVWKCVAADVRCSVLRCPRSV